MQHANISDFNSWYVIHTHRMQEERVNNNLGTLGIETLIPRYIKRRYNNYTGEVTHIIKPFFPNYTFARFDVSKLFHKVRLTRGVHSIVCYGTSPALVDDCIIAIIRSRIGEDGYIKIGEDGENLRPGDEVIIEDRLLKGFRGIFERETNDVDRVMVLLQTVSYQAHLVIEREVLKKVDQPNDR
jgi:transcription antitermination factor NusG